MMEANGAIFLPAAGKRIGTQIENVYVEGKYWTSSIHSYNNPNLNRYEARELAFSGTGGAGWGDEIKSSKYAGLSVRLVQGR